MEHHGFWNVGWHLATAHLSGKEMRESGTWRLCRKRLIKGLKVFFRIKNFNYSDCFFFGSMMREGCFFLGNALFGQLNLVGAFRWRASEEPGYCYVDLL